MATPKRKDAFRMVISAVSGAFGRVNGLITALRAPKMGKFLLQFIQYGSGSHY